MSIYFRQNYYNSIAMAETNIPKQQLLDFIDAGLKEDVRGGDHTSLACIPPDDVSTAQLLVKDVGVLAGVELAEHIFKRVDENAKMDIFMKDGAAVRYGDIAFKVTCNAQALLKAERLTLNTMQRMSGMATLSNRFAFEVEDLPVKILDTRRLLR